MFCEVDDGSEQSWLPSKCVPGSVYKDLEHNGLLQDPFINMNELNVRWVPERTWKYRTPVARPSTTAGERIDLVFKGLDTLATVRLNGAQILQAENMFVEYRVDVTEKLHQSDDNLLEIEFSSALRRGRELVSEHAHEHRFIAHQTENGRLPIRKAQYHWGWDWGPIMVDVGIWRPVYLETYAARVDDVWFQADIGDDLKTVSGKLLAKMDSTASSHVKFTLSVCDETVFESEAQTDESGQASCDFSLSDPSLWFPAGYGDQARYKLNVSLLANSDVSMSKLIGFRRVELVQEADPFGTSFYFRVNDIDIFCGGSCWIPADSFLGTMTEARYRDWMKLLIAGNQIMIRVWGGGVYEDSSFYTACDELGILVFQDFCMACQSTATYPDFLAQLSAEARYNIRRLRAHPALIVWAGNNEDYQIQERYNLDYDPKDTSPDSWLKSSFPARYIYEHLLPTILREEDPAALYHPSSPWGKGKQMQPDGRWTTDPTLGDLHQWHIWHGTMQRHQQAPSMSGRFVSEFGMEAYPHLSTLTSVITAPSQLHPGSLLMDHRNRAIDHERRLLTYVAENFRISYDLAVFTHLTQLLQADTMTSAYRSWRRLWGQPRRRRCGGVLVWQLNDCWPTISWAIADYHLIPKPAYYAIKRALTPVAVGVQRPFVPWTAGHNDPTLLLTERRYEVWIASAVVEVRTVRLEVSFVSIRSGKDVAQKVVREDVRLEGNATTEVIGGEVDMTMQQLAHEPVVAEDPSTWVENQASYFKYPTQHRKGVALFDLEKHDPFVIYARIMDGKSGEVLSTDTAWPDPLKYLDWPDRGVKVAVQEGGRQVKVTAERPVKGFVFREERGGGVLSDNGFDILPGEEKVVVFEKGVGDGSNLRWTYLGAGSGEEAL